MKTPVLAVLAALAASSLHAQSFEQQTNGILKNVRQRTAELKNVERKPVRHTLLKEIDPPMDLGSKHFTGRLTLEPDATVMLTTPRHAPMYLGGGIVTLKYGSPGFFSTFGKTRTIELSYAGQSALFEITTDKFEDFGTFHTPAYQSVILKGTHVRQQTGQIEKEGSESCNYSGYCMACGPRLGMDGKMHTDCSYGFHHSCSGSQKVLEQVTSFVTVNTVELWSVHSRRKVGSIVGDPVPSTKRKTLKVLGSCG